MSGPVGASRISLEQARKQAKELVKAHASADRKSLDTIRWNHPRFRGQSDTDIAAAPFALSDAQLIIAHQHHFESWPKLVRYVREQETADPVVARFEAAVEAIIAGEIDVLRGMLASHPTLVHQRSTRTHQSTLLHYVSANGVEGYRQQTPDNIVEIARLLLDAGAAVDATSNAYGGGSTTLGLASTSAHPRAKGVQIALIDLLLEYGARIDGEDTMQGLVSGALANGCPEAAVALASRGAHVNTLYAASGIGDIDTVRALFPGARQSRRESALMIAAMQGHTAIVRFLLDAGVSVSASDDMTALHYASAGGHLETMSLLLERGAPLEARNRFGGTVLDGTLWFAYNVHDQDFQARDYPRVLTFLIAAGARTDVYPEMQSYIEGVSARAERLNTTGL